MKVVRAFLFLFSVSLSPATAQAESDQTYTEAIAQISEWIQSEIDQQNYVGLAVGFAHEDFVWTEGFGHANLELDVPMTAESVHRLASVSKPITAVGIMKLVQDGVISLDDDVRKYVPDFPEKRWPVTIRRLLGHQAGVSHYRNFREEAHHVDRFTSEKALGIFKDWELLFEPGTDYSYTSYGFNLLAFVIEGATGQSFREYMTENIWLPLGMMQTRTDDIFDVIPNRVAGYEKINGTIYNCRPVTTTMKFGGGGMVSSAGDLLKFAHGLDAGTVLDPAWRDTMWMPMVMTTGERSHYAMGWSIDSRSGFLETWHTGGQEGTSTCLLHIPSLRFTAVVIGNLAGANPWAPCQEIFEVVIGQPYSLPNLYTGSRAAGAKLRHLEAMVTRGTGMFDLRGRPLTKDEAALTEAFQAINEALALDDVEKINAFFDSAAHPHHNDYLLKAGTHIAATLMAAHGRGYLETHLSDRKLLLLLDYQQLAQNSDAMPAEHELSKDAVTMVTRALVDWREVWTPELANTELDDKLQESTYTATLKQQFADKSVVPDFSRQISQQTQASFERADTATTLRLAQLNTELYPESNRAWLDRGFAAIAIEQDLESGQMMIRNGLVFGGLPANGHADINNRAYELAGMGRPELGKSMLDVAIELYPDVANIKDSKAEMYLLMGDTTNAIAWYRKALETDPEFENPRRMLERIGAEPIADPTDGSH